MVMDKEEFRYVDQHFEEFVAELRAAVRQPGIAAQNVGMTEAAAYFNGLLDHYGIPARLIPTDGGYPVVFGEIKGDSDRTVLFYDHYDVQPPDPLNEWVSDPFSGDIRDGKMYARGVSDNKGHACSRIQAIGTLLRLRGGRLPVNVKFLIEGEEEIGSPHLDGFIRDHQDLLRADWGVWESGYTGHDGRPGMYLGVKGILYVELEARGAERDMHSGAAASVPNPAWRLIWALSTIKNEAEEMDFRLVPNQDPADILRKLQAHLVAKGFDDIIVRPVTMDHPVKTTADHPVVKAAQDAALAVYGVPASIAPTQGGSGPMYPFQEYLNLPMVSFGVGYWASGNHGPNENIRLEDYRQGIKMVMEFVDRLGAL